MEAGREGRDHFVYGSFASGLNSHLLHPNDFFFPSVFQVFHANAPSETVIESIDSIAWLDDLVKKAQSSSDGIVSSLTSPSLLESANNLNKTVCSPFYRCLVKQDKQEQQQAWTDVKNGLNDFVKDGLRGKGSFFGGSSTVTVADIAVFPWVYRLYCLSHYRGMDLEKGEICDELLNWKGRMEVEFVFVNV